MGTRHRGRLFIFFAIAASKEAWVEEAWSGSIEGGCWAPRFLRPFNDWELEELESLLFRLQQKRISNMEDRVIWEGAKDGRCSVKRLYNAIDGDRLVPFPYKVLCNSRALRKWGFLLGTQSGARS